MIRPFQDFVVAEKVEKKESSGLIVLDRDPSKSQVFEIYKILRVSNQAFEEGYREDDLILCDTEKVNVITVDNKTYYIISSTFVVGVVEQEVTPNAVA